MTEANGIPGISDNGYTLIYGGVGTNISTFHRLMEQSNQDPNPWIDQVFEARVAIRQREGTLIFKL